MRALLVALVLVLGGIVAADVFVEQASAGSCVVVDSAGYVHVDPGCLRPSPPEDDDG